MYFSDTINITLLSHTGYYPWKHSEHQQSHSCAIYTLHSCQFDVSWLDTAVQKKAVGLLRFHMKTNTWNQFNKSSIYHFSTEVKETNKDFTTINSAENEWRPYDPFHQIRNMSLFPLLLTADNTWNPCNNLLYVTLVQRDDATSCIHLIFSSAWHGHLYLV